MVVEGSALSRSELSALHSLVAKLAADSDYSRTKIDEVCGRLEAVEGEIVGVVGDPERPSIRAELAEIRAFVRSAQESQRARSRWVAGLASGGLLAGLAAFLRGRNV